MIQCQNVHKSYRLGGAARPADRAGGKEGEVHALRGADLTIDRPGFYAIMGASGSGKSTLLHLLAGLDQPDSGVVSVGGVQLQSLSDRQLTAFRRTGVGIVFQQFNLIPTLTARENVELPGMLGGDDPARLTARARELLEALGVGHRADHRPDHLSGGEQQRVAIARALLYKPQVLLADEPTGALDSRNAEALWTLLGGVAAQQQVTVVMVTHEPAAAAHCGRVFVLKDGRFIGNYSTEGLDAGGVAARYQQLLA